MSSGTDWLRMKARPASLTAGQAAFVSEFTEALAEAVSMAWLNRNEMGGTWTTRLQRDLWEEGEYRWNKWAEAHDVRVREYLDTIHQGQEGKPSIYEWAARRGRVRNARGGRGTYATTAHGAIPWYVPEGAEWDMEAERSTKQWAWNSKSGYNIETVEHASWEELAPYHEQADALCVEEFEGEWDVAPPRRACRYYEDEMLSLFEPTSESYLEDGLKNGTSVEQDRAFNDSMSIPMGLPSELRRRYVKYQAHGFDMSLVDDDLRCEKPQRVLVPAVPSDPLDQLLDWLEGGWVT